MSTSIWVGSDGFMYLNQSTFAIITPTHRRVRVSGAAWHVHDAVGMGGPGAMPEDQDTRGLGRLGRRTAKLRVERRSCFFCPEGMG